MISEMICVLYEQAAATGDNTPLKLCIIVVAVAIILAILMTVLSKKKK